MRQFDAVVVPGTGVLCDYRADPFGAIYWIFRWCIAARLCGVKVCFINVGAGPVQRPLSRWMVRQAAQSASYRSFRDAYSRKFLAGLGVDTTNDRVYPDIAFRLPFATAPPRALATGQPATVGIGVMWYDGWQGHRDPRADIYERYLSQLGDFVCWLLQHGHPVRLLVGEVSDEPVIDRVKEHVRKCTPPGSAWAALAAEPIQSLHDLMREIDRTEIVVASRYHNIVCALKLGRPTISISYSVKHDELMQRAGIGGFCQDIETLRLDQLLEQFQDIAGNRVFYQALIGERVAEFQRELDEQEQVLLQAIVPAVHTRF